MERYIKYKRFTGTFNETTIQEFFDKLVSDGWEIIYYNEVQQPAGILTNAPTDVIIHLTIIGGKKQNDVL
jgi:hypothetical protein